MKRLVPTIVLVANVMYGSAQNYIADSNFEIYTSCPTKQSQLYLLSHWFTPTEGTPDYFNACNTASQSFGVPENQFGYQPASSGNGYAGIYAYDLGFDAKEYLSSALTCGEDRDICPLAPGVIYSVSIDVSLGEVFSNYGCNGLGVYFSTDTLPASYRTNWKTTLPFKPQIDYSSYGPITDTQNWVTLVDTFTADSAYRYIIVGGFVRDTSQDTVRIQSGALFPTSSYYFVDNVKVQPWFPTYVQDKQTTKVTVSPNPVTDRAVFRLTDHTGSYFVRVVNTFGQTVWQRAGKVTGDIRFERGSLPSGVYYYQLLLNGPHLQTGKLMMD